MTSNEIKQEVLQWIADGCDWDNGVMLYSVHGKNHALIKNIAGKKATQLGKLTYELCKSVGLDYHQLKSRIPTSTAKTVPTSTASRSVGGASFNASLPEQRSVSKAEAMPENIEVTRIAEYPAIIRRVIAEYAETFQERSKTHRIMTEMPEGNSQALKTKRAQLFGIVKSLTERLELLYDTQEVYKNTGFVPTEAEIWPTPKEKAKTELPDDVEILKKMKKNQQSANTKDQSLLDYQSEKQGTVKKPMPNGPKRMKLENRIKARLKMIEEIDYKLLKP
jgi:chaperonin cofactor prefoldin